MINEIQKRRLIGLIVLLAIAFVLSELLPHNLPESGEAGVPSTTLPLATNQGDGSSANPAPADDTVQAAASAPQTSEPQVAQAPEAAPSRPVDASAPPLPASAAPARPNGRAALPAEVSSMPSAVAAVEPTAAAPKPAPAKLADSKPQEAPKPAAKPAAPPQQQAPPQLKLAQSLPSPSDKSPPPAPQPAKPAAKPTPPPVPPVPKLATSVQAPPPPVAASQAKIWYVQIGSFADQGNAQTTLSLLQNVGYRGESTKITSSAGSALYRVRLGPFPSEAVAQQAYAKVSHQGYPQARVLSEASGKP